MKLPEANEIIDTYERLKESDLADELFDIYLTKRKVFHDIVRDCVKGNATREQVEAAAVQEATSLKDYLAKRVDIAKSLK